MYIYVYNIFNRISVSKNINIYDLLLFLTDIAYWYLFSFIELQTTPRESEFWDTLLSPIHKV